MDTETFWRLIEAARARVGAAYTADYDDRIAAALKAELVLLPADEIMEFDNRLAEVGAEARSVDMEAAAHLISNIFFDGWHGPRYYCFINGLMLLGRETFERAARSPDTLAEHPAIRAVPTAALPRVAFVAEEIYDVAGAAYCEVEDVDTNEYLRRLWGEDEKDAAGGDDEVGGDDEEEDFDDDDDEEREDSYYDQPFDRRWDKRLPRLMKLFFHRPGEVNPSSEFMKPIKADGLQGIFTPSVKSKRKEPATQTDDVFDAVLGQQGGWWRRWRRS
jgi:hypothetical protein